MRFVVKGVELESATVDVEVELPFDDPEKVQAALLDATDEQLAALMREGLIVGGTEKWGKAVDFNSVKRSLSEGTEAKRPSPVKLGNGPLEERVRALEVSLAGWSQFMWEGIQGLRSVLAELGIELHDLPPEDEEM